MNKIGVFDSGLGGLIILRNIRELLPQYDYVFFGDQKHVPYGEKSIEELLSYAKEALAFLYEKENCKVVLLACNTTSSTIYNQLRVWVNENYEGRYVWGVVMPTVKNLPETKSVIFFGTTRTIESHAYKNLLENKDIKVYEKALPKLASMIEAGGDTYEYLKEELKSLPEDLETVALVCTHYGIVLSEFKNLMPGVKNFVCQEDIIPKYLSSYLEEKPEFESCLSTESTIKFFVSAENETFDRFLYKWFGESTSKELWP